MRCNYRWIYGQSRSWIKVRVYRFGARIGKLRLKYCCQFNFDEIIFCLDLFCIIKSPLKCYGKRYFHILYYVQMLSMFIWAFRCLSYFKWSHNSKMFPQEWTFYLNNFFSKFLFQVLIQCSSETDKKFCRFIWTYLYSLAAPDAVCCVASTVLLCFWLMLHHVNKNLGSGRRESALTLLIHI